MGTSGLGRGLGGMLGLGRGLGLGLGLGRGLGFGRFGRMPSMMFRTIPEKAAFYSTS